MSLFVYNPLFNARPITEVGLVPVPKTVLGRYIITDLYRVLLG